MHFNETDARDSLGLMLFPASQTLGLDPEPTRTRKRKKDDGESNVQNFNDKYNIYN